MTEKYKGRPSAWRPPTTSLKTFKRFEYYPLSGGIDQATTEPWASIFRRCGLPEPKRGRAKCPFHDGNSNQSLSVDDDRGLFHCFVCHEAGDKLDFVRRICGYSFREALSLLGLASGNLAKPSPETVCARRIQRGLDIWVIQERRRIGKLLFSLNTTRTLAESRLETDPDDPLALFALSVVFRLYPKFEHLHDCLLSRNTDDRLRIFKEAA